MTDPGSVPSAIGPPGSDSGRECAFCHHVIAVGQHYLRLAVLGDTAGLEIITTLRLPETPPMFTEIYDHPVCAGLALAKAGFHDPVFLDVFGR